MTDQEFKKWNSVIDKAIAGGWTSAPFDREYADWLSPKEFVFSHAFARAFWGDAPMYLIDTSPDWAHDMGDTETTWVTEGQLREYCESELKHFDEEFPGRSVDGYDVVRESLRGKWEDPFQFAILELPAWQHHLQQLVLKDNYLDYLCLFVKEEYVQD